MRKIKSDFAVLTLFGCSFHHWGARTESRYFAEQALFALSYGGTSQPADVDERQSALAGAYGQTSVWRWMGAVLLMASTIVLNRMRAATRSQWRSWRSGVTLENLGRIWEDCMSQIPLQLQDVWCSHLAQVERCCLTVASQSSRPLKVDASEMLWAQMEPIDVQCIIHEEWFANSL